MYALGLGLLLVVLKWLEIGPVAAWSWWWVLAPFGVNDRLARTSMFRLTEDGWFESRRQGRRSLYALTAQGVRRFAHASRRIGRHLQFVDGAFQEVEDTRIAPGAALELAQGWRGGAVERAVRARVRIRVRPDDYYEGLYKARLRTKLTREVRAMFEQALADAEASPYVAYDETFSIESR